MTAINPSFRLCTQVLSARRKTLPSPLFVHANGGHRFPGCGQAREPSGDGEGVKFVTEQIWPPVSGHHLNPHLSSNVKYTPSPLLAFLNKWPPDTEQGGGGGARWIRACKCMYVCGCVWDLAFIFINLSFFLNSLHPSGEERCSDRTTQTHAITGRSHTHLGRAEMLQITDDLHSRKKYNHCSKLHFYCTAVRKSLGNMSNPREHLKT